VEPLAGQRQTWVRERRTKLDCAEVLRDLVDVVYPDAEKIVLVVDNLNIHHPACLYERFPPAEARRIAERIEWHYTPEHGSWLNIAEIELSVLKRQCLRGRLPDMDTVKRKVAAWQQRRNQVEATIDWRFTAEDARIGLKRLIPGFSLQSTRLLYRGAYTPALPVRNSNQILNQNGVTFRPVAEGRIRSC
jgi:hypothetical protein